MTNTSIYIFRLLHVFTLSLRIWGLSNSLELQKSQRREMSYENSLSTKFSKSYNTYSNQSKMQKEKIPRKTKSNKRSRAYNNGPNTPVPAPSVSNQPSPLDVIGGPSTSTSPIPVSVPSGQPSDTKCCNLSTLDYDKYLTDIAVSISGPISTGTPQQQALDWMKAENKYCECASDSCKVYERYSLAVFYFSTGGDEWNKCSMPNLNSQKAIDKANAACDITTTINSHTDDIGLLPDGTDAWLTPVDHCSWAGIACRSSSTCVDRLEFEQNNVIGTLPIELDQLIELRFLILERGGLTGPIPPEWHTLTELLHLDFDFNQLTSSIPNYIYGLTNMLQLDLNDNKLTGSISSSIGALTNLIYLQVDHNQFSGSLPSELGNLINLRVGVFSSNEFTGTISPILANNSMIALEADCGGHNPKVVCAPCTVCYEK